jgi:hypothetical protein
MKNGKLHSLKLRSLKRERTLIDRAIAALESLAVSRSLSPKS